MGSLWCNTSAEHVGTVCDMLGDGIWREGRVGETSIVRKARQTILERLDSGVVGITVHTVIVREFGMVGWAANGGYSAFR